MKTKTEILQYVTKLEGYIVKLKKREKKADLTDWMDIDGHEAEFCKNTIKAVRDKITLLKWVLKK
jgi:hypothetical protein